MIKVPYETIVEKICEKSDLTPADVEKKVAEKCEQLSGLVSKEGAAHIIANEMNIKILPKTKGLLKIKDILPGMTNIETAGRVTRKFNLSTFTTKDGRDGKVASMIIGDETGTIRCVLWNDLADEFEKLKEQTIIKLDNIYIKENNGRKEIHANQNSKLILDAKLDIPEVKFTSPKKQIINLQTGDNASILGTIVQLYDIKFYEVCPKCKKRIRPPEFKCPEHDKQEPDYSYLMNFVLDDGTETIRCVCFRNAVEIMLESDEDTVKQLRITNDFEPIKKKLLGKIIQANGRVQKNEMFDRNEFVAFKVDINPTPDEDFLK